MKRRVFFTDRVDVKVRDVTTTDARNNAVRTVTDTIEDVPALVTPADRSEDLDDRERNTEQINVKLVRRWQGADLAVPAPDVIVWQDRDYDVIGNALVHNDHVGRRDHLELNAQRIVG